MKEMRLNGMVFGVNDIFFYIDSLIFIPVGVAATPPFPVSLISGLMLLPMEFIASNTSSAGILLSIPAIVNSADVVWAITCASVVGRTFVRRWQ